MMNQDNVQPTSKFRPGIALSSLVEMVLLLGFVFGVAASCVDAQTCVLKGTVSVSSGNGQSERLPGASLNLIPDGAGQAQRSAITNEQGEYKFDNLSAGLYTLQIALTGFKQRTEKVMVHPGITSLEIALEVEGVSGEVTVAADGGGLNTTDATPPTTFNQHRLETVPLANERFQDAIPLVPGVV